MKKNVYFFVLFLFILTSCCREKHFINDSTYRYKVEKQFNKQRKLAENRKVQLFSVFNQKLSQEETEALKFLYAYMPLSDLADNDGPFFLANVRTSLMARDSFAWGKIIPEAIFRHFVLPVRVNNENLDSARMVFFKELKPRVKNLSMKEAVLAVNHWCHEKVTYRPSDMRTSSPLNTVMTSFGRCGEESTFTVAALRSVGIPARQCYTPRWAHCDDNHAWVEVWVDGKWHYLGACEPEQQLDVAWFSAPAKRAMLVSTNVFGDYSGPEEVLLKTEYYTRINLLSNYAPVKTISVKVQKPDGSPADSAEVEFCLYNYAEFFPLAKKYTDKKGMASFTTGLGDLLIWVNDGKDYAFKKITVEKIDMMVMHLKANHDNDSTLDLDLVPPVERPVNISYDENQKTINSRMLKLEDSIRGVYMASFADSISSIKLADELMLNRDSTWHILRKSEGNWKEIKKFMNTAPANHRQWALPLLYSLAEKDLHDTPADVLLDNLNFNDQINDASKALTRADFVNYVLCPRIELEKLKKYKSALYNALQKDITGGGKPTVKNIIDWVKRNIKINTIANYYNVSVTPAGTFELKVADKNSRNILFVAICRTFGFPARIEVSTKKPQYLINDNWQEVNFDKPELLNTQKGSITLLNVSKVKDFVPKYYVHYTLAIFKDGKYRTLDYEDSPEVSKYPCTLTLEAGKYMMVTGNRKADGSVLASLHFFELKAGEHLQLPIKLRESPAIIEVLGTLNLDTELNQIGKVAPISPAGLAKDKPCIMLWIDPDKEPTKHVLNEIRQLKELYEKWGGGMLFLLSDRNIAHFDLAKYNDLPKQKIFAVDAGYNYLMSLEKVIHRQLKYDLPAIVVVNQKGEVTFLSTGYRIGTGEQLIKALK